MAYIYKITNDINEKVYIGKTCNSIQKRFKEHCKDSSRLKLERRPLYSAMRKYGTDKFHIEAIEECAYNVAGEREQYWIEFYDSYKNGYNATLGGDGKPFYDYDKMLKLYHSGKT